MARTETLQKIRGVARSLSPDLQDQWNNLEKTRQFRFTPLVQSLTASWQAPVNLDEEGRVPGIAAIHKENHATILAGTRVMALKEYLTPNLQGHIITTFHYPNHPNFSFEKFYSILNQKGMVTYPGKLTKVSCFRVGNIGCLFLEDMKDLLEVMRQSFNEMEIPLPLSQWNTLNPCESPSIKGPIEEMRK